MLWRSPLSVRARGVDRTWRTLRISSAVIMPAPPPPMSRKAVGSSDGLSKPNVSGCWTMSDSRPGSRDQFHYEWFHEHGSETFTGTDNVSGGSDGPLQVRGRVRGSHIEWRIGELECSGCLLRDADSGWRVIDGRCFQAGSSRVIGRFTGRRVGSVDGEVSGTAGRPSRLKTFGGGGRTTAGYPHRMISLATAVFNEDSSQEAHAFGASAPTLFERVLGQVDNIFGIGASDRLQSLSLDREIAALERRRQALNELSEELQHANARIERRLQEKTELRKKSVKRLSISELTTMCSGMPVELHSDEINVKGEVAFQITKTDEYEILHM